MRGITAGAVGGKFDLTDKQVTFKGANDNQIRFGGGDDPTNILSPGNTYQVKQHSRQYTNNTVKLEGIEGNFNAYLFKESPIPHRQP